jgi:hypothetical protein
MKRKRSARQLAEVIAGMLVSRDVRVQVHPDPVYGFSANAYGSDPNSVHASQLQIEQILPALRDTYELAD